MLGDISAQKFLQRYWQREPLLIRKALTDYRSPISPDELAGLALEAEVESRLVEGREGLVAASRSVYRTGLFTAARTGLDAVGSSCRSVGAGGATATRAL